MACGVEIVLPVGERNEAEGIQRKKSARLFIEHVVAAAALDRALADRARKKMKNLVCSVCADELKRFASIGLAIVVHVNNARSVVVVSARAE